MMDGVEFHPEVQNIDPKNYTTDWRVQEFLQAGTSTREIVLIDCPACGCQSFYDQGFTCGCTWCGEDIAQYSDDAYSLDDYLWGVANDEYHQGAYDD